MAELEGVIVATVTPFTKQGTRIDPEWIPLHLDFLRRRGVQTLLPLGSAGEFASMTLEERKQVIDLILGARGEFTLVVGIGGSSLTETIALAHYAFEKGAASILVIPPYTYGAPTTEGLFDFHAALIEEAVPVGRGIILYNIPQSTGVEITNELLERLLKRYPRQVLGIKDASRDPDRTRRYAESFPNLRLFGTDTIAAAALDAGAVGIISAVANVYPGAVEEVYRTHHSGEDTEPAQRRLSRIRAVFESYPLHGAIKYTLHVVGGLPQAYIRPPLVNLNEKQQDRIWKDFEEMGLL